MCCILRVVSATFLVVGMFFALGCTLSQNYLNLPEGSEPSKKMVLNAAKEVIQERYPMSYASDSGGYVHALTHVGVDGNYRTRKQISVLVRQNYTGAYEPVVRVRRYADTASPELSADPRGLPGGSPNDWSPFADYEWVPTGFLPYEEQELADAIQEKIASLGL